MLVVIRAVEKTTRLDQGGKGGGETRVPPQYRSSRYSVREFSDLFSAALIISQPNWTTSWTSQPPSDVSPVAGVESCCIYFYWKLF